MDFQQVLDAVAAGESDYSASKKLGITRQRFSNWRNKRDFPSDKLIPNIAQISGLPIEKVYIAVMAEKCHIPEVKEYLSTLAA